MVTTLRQWRTKINITLAEEAALLGVSVASVWRYETGNRRWPLAVAIKLKAISGGVLTDESFAPAVKPPRAPRRSPRRAA